jgi:hypothetical protein
MKKIKKKIIGKKKNNPNGANQYKVDPRQALFLAYYLDPKSETFSNGLQSALKAGYEKLTAKVLVSQCPDWLSEKLNNAKTEKMAVKAERVLDEMLDMPVDVQELTGKGKNKAMVVKTEPALVKVKQDTAKFVAERLGKDKWSSRNELTGKGGQQIVIQQITGMKIYKDGDSTENQKSETK